MADLSAAAAAREHAVCQATHKEQARAWNRWKEWLAGIENRDDDFLDKLSIHERHIMRGGFAAAVRRGQFSKERDKELGEGTVRASVDYVSQTFRARNRRDPRHDDEGHLAHVLQRQFRGYKNQDSAERPQHAISATVLRTIFSLRQSPIDEAIAQLLIGAFFFAMRSCEYCNVTGSRRTKLLTLGNLRFLTGKKELHHKDDNLSQADTISITFEFQKRDTRNDIITMPRSGDPILCPVKAWAFLTQRILAYPGCTSSSPVNTAIFENRILTLSATTVLQKLRSATALIGKDSLGFEPAEVGLHSLRSGAAMAMYLAHVPTCTIMLIGRWSSDSFLRYIRRQVQQFSTGVSEQMLTNQSFYTIPEVNIIDPRTTNNSQSFASRNKFGRDAQRHASTLRFALFT
ncbi:MAG: hypothetical protein ACREBR_01565 [bacterium]